MTDPEWCPEPLWLLAYPLLPEAPQRHQGGGRRRLNDRAVLAAILYVLRTGCAWSALPSSFGVSAATAHRRFTEWVEAAVFTHLHQMTLGLLGSARGDRLVTSVGGRHAGQGSQMGGPDRPQPGRPRQTGVEDSRDERARWHPAVGDHPAANRNDHLGVRGCGGRGRAGRWAGRTASTSTGQTAHG